MKAAFGRARVENLFITYPHNPPEQEFVSGKIPKKKVAGLTSGLFPRTKR